MRAPFRMNACHYDKRMDFFYNQSKSQTEDDWTGTKLIMLFCFGAFCSLFIFLSNLLVIAAVVINKRFHYPFYYLLANLAAADLFSGIAYIFMMFHTGPVSKTLTVHRWFLRQGLLDTSMTASLANLLVIAVERHISIVRMRIHTNLTKRRVTCLILLIWGIAIFMGAVPTLGWNCICDITTCSSLAPLYSRSYLTFWTVSNLLVFLIMVVVYLRIYMYVQRKTNVLSSHTTGSISRRRTPIKLMKTVMTVLGFLSIIFTWFLAVILLFFNRISCPADVAVTVSDKSAFVICWTPGMVVLLLDGLNCTQCGLQQVKRWFLLLALTNSVINPIIYSYKDEEMWRTFKGIMRCSFYRGNRRSSRFPSTVNSTRSNDTTTSHYLEEIGSQSPTVNAK